MNESLVLQSKAGGDFKPHPEGIYSAVCLDVVGLGMVEVEFQGQRRMVPKLRAFFETEYRDEQGRAGVISRTFTASLHPKARLAEFIGKWRGRPVVPGETIDLGKLIGACCTLVISHQQNMVGRTYACIDAVSKPTKKLTPSGQYDPAETRRRIAEWQAKERQNAEGRVQNGGREMQNAEGRGQNAAVTAAPKRQAEVAAPLANAPHQAPSTEAAQEFDPEVGF